MTTIDEKLKKARELSWHLFGKEITFYLPGMFSYDGFSGNYPAVSITGDDCALQCDHCMGSILKTMIGTLTPQVLLEKGLRLAEKGNHGILISGGCDEEGALPWEDFIPVIRELKSRTDLYISIHSGLVDYPMALRLKEAGVDQALIDVIGDDGTYRRMYHVPFGISRIESSMEAMARAGLSMIPHIVCGLDFGRIKGERKAVEIISRFHVEQVVIVSLMPVRGTPVWNIELPGPEDVAEIIAEARMKIPHARISLGCARQRGNTAMEILAIDAGVNRMALPSGEAVERAKYYGLEIRYQRTCCSVSRDYSKSRW
ncbi:MAG: hypothetical protein JRJ85_17120 [Deltaproteobacteria bacterium]|nr:hypothetical protein [Deltaproteobacteria bacterium]